MEKITYFNGHFPVRYVSHYQRVPYMGNPPITPPSSESGHQTRGVRCLERLRDVTWHGPADRRAERRAELVVSGGEDGGAKLWPMEVERKRCLVEVEQWFSKPWLRLKKWG